MHTTSIPRVIAIAAVSGGGKTTITRRLTETLPHAAALYFDDYTFEECPEDICEWVENGADYDDWNLAPLARDLQSLLRTQPPPSIVILDYPFAYLNSALRGHIDLSIFIDTPLDIALARRILRDYSEGSIDDVREDVTGYLQEGRMAYAEMLSAVKPNSDFVIDGSLPVDDIVKRILDETEARFKVRVMNDKER
ncbi:hypothetical protein ABD76_28360 [Paenibacillus dendritiformis]|uniref:hypothetical protein n=1 Tax=Paenibacillus dendritiformis TaxID=130049 RepID=UPI0018CEA362|nr:hypothetical protein [Paenibacillus dendritiformis]MBG9796127.1 hypothetical protein [Paenibacillus dendritiformis]